MLMDTRLELCMHLRNYLEAEGLDVLEEVKAKLKDLLCWLAISFGKQTSTNNCI